MSTFSLAFHVQNYLRHAMKTSAGPHSRRFLEFSWPFCQKFFVSPRMHHSKQSSTGHKGILDCTGALVETDGTVLLSPCFENVFCTEPSGFAWLFCKHTNTAWEILSRWRCHFWQNVSLVLKSEQLFSCVHSYLEDSVILNTTLQIPILLWTTPCVINTL